MGGQRVAYAMLLLVLETVFTLFGVTARSPADSITVVYRWSAPAGVVIMIALLAAGLARSWTWVAIVVGIALARVVVVIVALVVVGSNDPNGRADSSYLLIFLHGTVIAVAALLLAASTLRVIGRSAR